MVVNFEMFEIRGLQCDWEPRRYECVVEIKCFEKENMRFCN